MCKRWVWAKMWSVVNMCAMVYINYIHTRTYFLRTGDGHTTSNRWLLVMYSPFRIRYKESQMRSTNDHLKKKGLSIMAPVMPFMFLDLLRNSFWTMNAEENIFFSCHDFELSIISFSRPRFVLTSEASKSKQMAFHSKSRCCDQVGWW